MMPVRHLLASFVSPVVTPVFVALTVVSCSGGTSQPSVHDWFDDARAAVAAHPPDTDVMQIDPTATCDLVDDLTIDGRSPELFGAGTATFGDIGTRYQCAWSGDANQSANVRLEVAMIDRRDDFETYAASIPTRDDNTVVSTPIGDVQIASVVPDGGTRPVTSLVLVRDDERGGIHAVVELLGDTEWKPEKYAAWLAARAPTIDS